MIDYVIGDEGIKDKVGRLEVGDRIDSNPVEVWMKGKRGRGEEVRKGKKVKGCRGVWSEEGSKEFVRRLKEKGIGTKREGVGVNGEWEEMESKMRKTLQKVEEECGLEKERKNGWWDEECKERKREVRRELREWKRKGGEGREYRKKRKEYAELCKRKKKKENEKWEKRMKEVRRESKVWEIMNRERKKRKRINEGIEVEEWKEGNGRSGRKS